MTTQLAKKSELRVHTLEEESEEAVVVTKTSTVVQAAAELHIAEEIVCKGEKLAA